MKLTAGTREILLPIGVACALLHSASAGIQSGLPDEGTQGGRGPATFSSSPTASLGDNQMDEVVTEIIRARTLHSLRLAVSRLGRSASKPSDYAAVKAAITSVSDRYPNLSRTQREAFSTIMVQLLVDCRRAGANKAALFLAIRIEALSAVYADTPNELTDSLAHNNELRAELDQGTISEAFRPLADVLPANRLAHVKQVFLDCTENGDVPATKTMARAASGESPIERSGDRRGGNTPSNFSVLVGSWSAAVIGEASGMSVASYYTFRADGTYSRTSQAAFSGGGGTYIGRPGQSGGSWSLEQRTLRLTPDNGTPSTLKISNLSSEGMITVRSNGDRMLWEKRK